MKKKAKMPLDISRELVYNIIAREEPNAPLLSRRLHSANVVTIRGAFYCLVLRQTKSRRGYRLPDDARNPMTTNTAPSWKYTVMGFRFARGGAPSGAKSEHTG